MFIGAQPMLAGSPATATLFMGHWPMVPQPSPLKEFLPSHLLVEAGKSLKNIR